MTVAIVASSLLIILCLGIIAYKIIWNSKNTVADEDSAIGSYPGVEKRSKRKETREEER